MLFQEIDMEFKERNILQGISEMMGNRGKCC